MTKQQCFIIVHCYNGGNIPEMSGVSTCTVIVEFRICIPFCLFAISSTIIDRNQ